MRIRNIKNKKEILGNSKLVLNHGIIDESIFNNDNPIYLEIGSGKCDFIIKNAIKYPNINFIGIEKTDTVLAIGVRDITEDIPNLRLLNFDANNIDTILNKKIDTLYLNFSDPWPKNRHEERRLTSEKFLIKYDKIFSSRKRIVIKTDNKDFFEYSITSLSKYGYVIVDISLDLEKRNDENNISTEYERKFMNKGCKIYMMEVIKE